MYPTDKNSLYHKRVENLLGAKNIESVVKKSKKYVLYIVLNTLNLIKKRIQSKN